MIKQISLAAFILITACSNETSDDQSSSATSKKDEPSKMTVFELRKMDNAAIFQYYEQHQLSQLSAEELAKVTADDLRRLQITDEQFQAMQNNPQMAVAMTKKIEVQVPNFVPVILEPTEDEVLTKADEFVVLQPQEFTSLFEIQIDNDATGEIGVVYARVSETKLAVSLSEKNNGDKFTVKARARLADDASWSPWSAPRKFAMMIK